MALPRCQEQVPAPEKPKRTRKKKVDKPAEEIADQVKEDAAVVAGPDDAPQAPEPATAPETGKVGKEESAGTVEDAKPKRGWWQRTFGD